MYRPLEGIKILDCTRLLPYQYCTMLLGDLGAEVLKIEEPRQGDYGRWGDGDRTYESEAFVMTNRNKKSLKLNLKHDKGRAILKKLAIAYSVLVESFRPGVMARLGRQRVLRTTTGSSGCGIRRHKRGQSGHYLLFHNRFRPDRSL